MRRLTPDPRADVDVGAVYGTPVGGRARPADRPWVTMLMISAADGAIAIDGRSGGLGGPGDRAVYRAVRGAANAILVGAATARAEGYRPVAAPQRLLIVTGSGDAGSADLVTAATTTLVMPTGVDAPDGAHVLRAGATRADLGVALRALDGVDHVVCEGGPSLNGQLLAHGLVDEVCLTLAPRLLSGRSSRVAHDDLAADPEPWALAHVLADDEGFLFLRYVRTIRYRTTSFTP